MYYVYTVHTSHPSLPLLFSPSPVPPAPITSIDYSFMSLKLARIHWTVDYHNTDEEPDYIIITVETNNRSEKRDFRLDDREVWMKRYYDVEVVPGMQYWVTLLSVNNNGTHTSDVVLFKTAPDSKLLYEYVARFYSPPPPPPTHTHTHTHTLSLSFSPTAPSVVTIIPSRFNQTACTITAELEYTGGGKITHFSVNFRVVGDASDWTSATDIPTELVPNSNNMWTGIIKRPEFDVYSLLEFEIQVTNEEGLTSDPSTYLEMQGLYR